MTPPRAHRRIFSIGAVVLLVAGALALVVAGALARGGTGAAELHGVRLGMTVRDVRARFDAAAHGTWDSKVGEDVVLSWKPATETRGGPLSATFEFHLGILMAVRAKLPPGDPGAKGPPFQLSDSAVVLREPDAHGVALTAIARSCPIHKDEVERILAKHAPVSARP